MEKLYVFRFYLEKKFAPGNGGRGGGGWHSPPWLHFPYGPEVIYNFSIKSAHNKDF